MPRHSTARATWGSIAVVTAACGQCSPLSRFCVPGSASVASFVPADTFASCQQLCLCPRRARRPVLWV